MNHPAANIPPQTVVPGQPGSVSAAAQNAIHAWVSTHAGIIDTRSADPRTAFIKVLDTAPTSDGMLTGEKLHDAGSLDPASWTSDETVHVVWPGGSNVPPELPVNTFGEARIYLGWRIGIATSGGNYRAVYLVTPSTVVVPVYLANLTPTTGYHDATIDGTGESGGGSSSTCWAKCLNSGGVALSSYGPYLGLLSGKVTNSGSERPRVVFFAAGITITGETSGAMPVTDQFVNNLQFQVGDFYLTVGSGAINLTHLFDEIAVSAEGVLTARAIAIDFLQPSSGGGSGAGNVEFTTIDQGSGVVSVEANVDLSAAGYVPTSDVATSPAANKIMRADANGTSTYTPSATHAGLNVGPLAGDPSSPVAGNIHYNSSVGRYKIYR